MFLTIKRFPNFRPSLTNVPEICSFVWMIVPCEWLFSSVGYIANKTRSSLDANAVNMLVCLQSVVIPRRLSEKTRVLFTVLTEILKKFAFWSIRVEQKNNFVNKFND